MNQSPHSLEQLQALLNDDHKEGPKLGARAQVILQALLHSPEQVTLLSISELSAVHNVNPSTLSRLVRKLGFKGFKEFQAIFNREVAAASQFYSSQASRLIDLQQQEGTGHNNEQSPAQYEMQNLVNTIKELDPNLIKDVASVLAQASAIHIIGLRGCFSAAHFLGYYLGFIHNNVNVLGGVGATLAEDCSAIKRNDAFVAIAFHPETQQTIDACKLAKEANAQVITISDNSYSLLNTLGDYSLLAHSDGPFFFNPMASLFMLIESIITQVATERGPEAIAMMKQREHIFNKLHVEVT